MMTTRMHVWRLKLRAFIFNAHAAASAYPLAPRSASEEETLRA